ncbi:MAG: ATP phosphoribosyltransferase [Dehalococcoidales bacterium]|nr:ATP phosphoribosyltransferase [Dehalococcoidales bacterium]
MRLKIALPKGRLLGETAVLLDQAGWGLDEYREGTRSYRLKSQKMPDLFAKVFQEKDIPVQVAVGNYDLGICGLDWVEELLAKYPGSALVKLRDLGYGKGALYAAASRSLPAPRLDTLQKQSDIVRLASEYPNLAESLALDLRLKRFSVFPLWGGAEVYPPENAELILISRKNGENTLNHDLVAVSRVLEFSAYLIANRFSWESKDLSSAMASLEDILARSGESCPQVADIEKIPEAKGSYPVREVAGDVVRLALADGHQQQPTIELLNKAGIRVDDYPSSSGKRRPTSNLDGVTIKVIRPQDMPLQVANGNFDLAITGKDWLTEHLNQFPASPVVELLDLKFGWVRIVAVVSNEVPVTDAGGLRQLWAGQAAPIRVASEYVNIADKYARDNHLGLYRIIPTWGATEAFLTEDADLLIENTQTGSTLARNNLKIIDTLFESTARLIANKDSLADAKKRKKIESITKTLRGALA